MTMNVAAFDAYYTGALTDLIEDIGVAPLGERFFGIFDGDRTSPRATSLRTPRRT